MALVENRAKLNIISFQLHQVAVHVHTQPQNAYSYFLIISLIAFGNKHCKKNLIYSHGVNKIKIEVG